MSSTTPTEEINPASISDIFATDPLSLTKVDRRRIIEEFRKNRVLWIATGKGVKNAATPKVKPGKLTLEDLGL